MIKVNAYKLKTNYVIKNKVKFKNKYQNMKNKIIKIISIYRKM